jgi:outer membrane murein-binding lipoprotein Lpp
VLEPVEVGWNSDNQEREIKGTDMMKYFKFSYTAIGLIIFLLSGSVYASGFKTTELNRKMGEISSLQQGLSDKIALAMDKRNQLGQKTEALQEEIRQQKDELQIDSYQKGILIPRIDYNLKLIQLLLGYITGLNAKILYFQNGLETLGYYRQQAQDDLLMIKTLNDLEVDKLIAQINSALDEYTPETTKPLFDVDGVSLKDTEQIWNEIFISN